MLYFRESIGFKEKISCKSEMRTRMNLRSEDG